jgi:hypothetical protein
MLEGDNCETKEGGYSKEIITKTIKYIKENRKWMPNITARVAAKIADTMEMFPDDWQTLIQNQSLTSYE